MRQFGLIGFPLSHSFSKGYFSDKFLKEGLADCSYELYPLPNIELLPSLINETPLLKGLNVTIPYKEKVLSFVDIISPAVSAIGACNCIKIINHTLHAFNTDIIGFEMTLKYKLQPWHKQALIFGTGGAAKAVAYVLDILGIGYYFVSRNENAEKGILGYDQVNEQLLQNCLLLINTTPLGMYPNTADCPQIAYQFITTQHYLYDLVYNPSLTLFLQKGQENGAAIQNGYAMLLIQAEESWKIWNKKSSSV